MEKHFAPSCERNQEPILSVLDSRLTECNSLLEIGSGNGQHAVFFAQKLPHLIWQTSDLIENHAQINAWLDESTATNLRPPLFLNVQTDPWPKEKYDAVFSANTAHIMSWEAVKAFFAGVGDVLAANGRFFLYGPFNYHGQFTSESNAKFEQWLKNIDVKRGIRDFEAVCQLAEQFGMKLLEDIEMPANNRFLIWQKI